MELRHSREMAKLGQKRVTNSRPKTQQEAPDLTDFMNDMFFGAVNKDKKAYNLTGNEDDDDDDDDEEWFDRSNRSRNEQLTDEWLDEARRLVASSPSRCNSPARLAPRFAAAANGRSSASIIDRRDPLS
ncbi:hypothetical protein Csa_014140, partial [Cucumis sativus]